MSPILRSRYGERRIRGSRTQSDNTTFLFWISSDVCVSNTVVSPGPFDKIVHHVYLSSVDRDSIMVGVKRGKKWIYV